jgi:DNA-directed RNA polymerase subunit alpha
MLERGSDAMLSIRNFGEKSLDELCERLQEKGYLLDEKEDEAEEEAVAETE